MIKEIFTKMIVASAAFLLPLQPLVLVVGFFIICDTLFALYKCHKLKQEITSRKLSQVVSKLVLYTGATLAVYMLEAVIIGDLIKQFSTIPFVVTKIVSASLCLIELKSIDEKYIELYGYSLWKKAKDLLLRAKDFKDEIK
jgi:hypothetical protein